MKDCTVVGTMEISEPVEWGNPLAALPQPEDDLTLQRTYPTRIDEGSMSWEQTGLHVDFVTELPRRYGALGCLPRRGLWANGGWYPQPLVDEAVPLVTWTASVQAEGEVVLNGPGAHWEGTAERLSLAVLPRGRHEQFGGLHVYSTGPRRPRRDAELEALVAADEREVVVVEAPMFRRLVRPGTGVVYVSDMAFRLWRPLYRYHRQAVLVGVLQASSKWEDPWMREIEAAALARELDLGGELERLLRFGTWAPAVDYLMYSGRIDFHAEVFDETFPADPLQDDLLEIFAPRVPGRVLAAKLDDHYGPGTSLDVAHHGIEGAGVDPDFVETWRRPYPEQDLVLEVHRSADGSADWTVTLTRDAAEDAPPEPIPYTIDGEAQVWAAPKGPSSTELRVAERPKVALDPLGHVKQTSLLYDTWPTRWTATFAGGPETVNLAENIFIGVVWATLRRQYDTHNTFRLVGWTGERSRAAGALAYTRTFGALQDRRTRAHRVTTSLSAALLNPQFRSTDDGALALEIGASYRWDSRVAYHFPLQGQGVRISMDTGFVPGSTATWGSVSAGGLTLLALHPRIVLALAARGGLAFGDVEHRLFSLGGSSAMRSIAPGTVVGTEEALASIELRLQPLRNASLPLAWFYWFDAFQLNGGLEAGTVDGVRALGWMGGFRMTLDGLGAFPWTWGFTVARPIWQAPVFDPDPPLQIYLRFGQEF